ncbi:MAG TPA: replicative DNA helicase [Nostocaceae cyanobacterium]|nr:replicative DNA helicase [Nostocaceae cyanobacterium]
MAEELSFQGDGSDRLPPQNIEAEEAILGGILLDPEAISRVSDRLLPEAFYISAHKEIYQGALFLHREGKPTDLLSITNWLTDHDLLAKIGGRNKLATLVDRTVSAVNIDALAAIVMDKYMRRRLIKAGGEVVHLGYETETELSKVLDNAEQKVFNVTQTRSESGLTHISQALVSNYSDIEERQQGIALPGISTGFYDLDAILNGGFQRSDLIIVAGRPAMGKCVASDTEILLSDGSVATIAEIYHHRQANLFTLKDDWKLQLTQPSAYIDDGIKPVFRVTTRLGRYVETTLTHPYLTINGWLPLAELKVGDKIAIPRKLDIFGTATISECEVQLLAYLIGDGCLTGVSPQFTNSNPILQADFAHAATDFSENSLTLWLDKLGIWGKNAHEKIIPEIVFRLKRSLVALFLNRLFATDGWATVLKTEQAQLGYCTVSEKLARQTQHLLLRFGIIANLKNRLVKYQNEKRPAWQLDITDTYSIKNFIAEIGIFGKETALDKVTSALSKKTKNHTNRDLIPVEIWSQIAAAKGNEPWSVLAQRAGIKSYSNLHVGKRALSRERLWILATALDNLPLQQLANSDVYWDEIVSIESMGNKQVYDLTIPHTHNFIANDICVHNTSFSMNIAHYIAANFKFATAIFSLEMSKEQLALRLLASEAGIESSYLRSGRVSQNQWDVLTRSIDILNETPIFIDDTANITVTEMRSQARKLQAESRTALGLILIDYLQLMEGAGDNRVQELSRITRSLKGLARELSVPVIALSQLSRGVEARTNKRPMLSDLRESGCLTGDSLITLADSGLQVPIRELIGKSGFAVWALNENTMQLEKGIVSNAFSTGIKPVFSLTTRLGRKIKATANHKFLTINGWKRLDELAIGDKLALPNQIIQNTPKQEALAIIKSAGTATIVKSEHLQKSVNSDIYWDEIIAIAPDGEEEVYDLTVPVHHNFVANNIIVHNSIEQDADLVLMLYRDEYYSPDTPDRGIAEVIIAKHRNGPTGTVKLLFEPQFTKFKNLARSSY